MRKFLWILFKSVLAIIVAVLVMALVFYVVVVRYQESPWLAFSIIGMLIGAAILAYFILHYLRRLQQKKFVEHIVAQDDLMLQKVKNEEYKRINELRERWTAAVKTLKNTSLIHHGNPLYVLPWYMILGETDSGKSSSIANCGLHSINSSVGPVPGVTTTQNCDWWFFDNAIVIDTAGKYAVPVDGKIDEVEWQELLVQIATYRKKEPINGILVTLPTEKLLSQDDSILDSYGSFISERINRIVRVLNARIPVYVLITKIDLLSGFNAFAKSLPIEVCDQACGYTSNTEESHLAVVDKTVESICNNVRDVILKLESSVNDDSLKQKADLLIFSRNFAMLFDKLKRFVQVSFDNCTYHEKVILRGMYISSALQTGNETSLFASQFVKPSENVERSHGMFLRNVFKEILPRDRGLYQPVLEFLKWRTLSSNLALMSVAILSIAFIGFLSLGLSFSENKSKDIGSLMMNTLEDQSLDQRVYIFYNMINEIDKIEDDPFYRYQLKFTRHALDESILTAKTLFIVKFEEYLMKNLMNYDYWDSFISDPEYSFEAQGDAILFYSILSSYYERQESGESLSSVKEMVKDLKMINPEFLHVGQYNRDRFVFLLSQYLEYKSVVHKTLDIEKIAHVNVSKYLMDYRDFVWIPYWANYKAVGVRAGAYWPVLDTSVTSTDIEGAFTIEGFGVIEKLLNAMPKKHDQMHMDHKKSTFREYYTANFKQKWIAYMRNFYSAIENSPIDQRLSILPLMSDPSKNPFFKMQSIAYNQLSFISKYTDVDLQYMKIQQRGIETFSTMQKSSVVGNIVNKGEFQINGLISKVGNTNAADEINEIESVANDSSEFFKFLTERSQVYSSKKTARVALTKLMSGDLSTLNSTNIVKIIGELRDILEVKASDKDALTKPSGFLPYDDTAMFYKKLLTDMVACDIQQSWINNIYSRVFTGKLDQNKLFSSENGVVDLFVDKDLENLIYNDGSGYSAVEESGMRVPFKPDFLTFLDKGGDIQRVYKNSPAKIRIKTIPIEVNEDALMQPNSVILDVTCKEGNVLIENYNYPNEGIINWNDDNCTEISMEIAFDNFTLKKEFDGQYGLSDFLNLFKDGVGYTFHATDFSNYKSILNSQRIEWIKVAYNISGADNLIKYFNYQRNPLGLPREITECTANK